MVLPREQATSGNGTTPRQLPPHGPENAEALRVIDDAVVKGGSVDGCWTGQKCRHGPPCHWIQLERSLLTLGTRQHGPVPADSPSLARGMTFDWWYGGSDRI